MKLAVPTREVRLTVGGRPQVNLLPEDLRAARRMRRTRKVMTGFVVASVVVAAAACGGAFVYERHTADQLAAAQRQADTLLGAQSRFAGVTSVRRALTSSAAAQHAAAVRMIDWESYMDQLAGRLPAGLTIGSIAVDSTAPSSAAGGAGAAPAATPAPVAFSGAYVATVTVHVVTAHLSTVQSWLASLTTIKGYVDASPGAVTTATAGGLDVAVTVHLNSKAYTTPAAVGVTSATDTATESAPAASAAPAASQPAPAAAAPAPTTSSIGAHK
jgi:hypothetical protein